MQTIKQYIAAGFPLIWVTGYEENIILEDIFKISKDIQMGAKIWSCTKGWFDPQTGQSLEMHPSDQISCFDVYRQEQDNMIHVFTNFHFFLDNYMVLQKIRDMVPFAKHGSKPCIFLSPYVQLPAEIEKEVALVEYRLPDVQELGKVLDIVMSSVDSRIEITDRTRLLEAALGMTCAEAENAFAVTLVRHGSFHGQAITEIQREKTKIIRRSGLLEYIEPSLTLDDIGGNQEIKDWLLEREQAFTPMARDYGIKEPAGLLYVGVPGCGKSLAAKAASAAWQLPLLRFPLDRVFGSLVGQSEKQMRAAIELAETLSPCILWIDELDKAFSGLGNGNDGGVTNRIFGQLLTWMQEKSKPVFLFATANDVTSLPPELLRRFDEIFWADLPQKEERQEIWHIHIARKRRNPQLFDLNALAEASEGYSGAEIEKVLEAAMFYAFSQKRDFTTDDMLRAIQSKIPLSITMKEKIEAIRAWGKLRAKSASRCTGEIDLSEIEERSALPKRRITLS
ncbi:AAA family ATPase [Paenibacillus sp. 32352]|uniref:AAA family ATPase n=1 Tax=Paenibacillus sp. 32352 TaxID=1969111 RepID=UPI0009AD36A0|nr:AAA family ATPase [Paenibacillus sp. 32352]